MTLVPFVNVFRRSALKLLALSALGFLLEVAWQRALDASLLDDGLRDISRDIRWSLTGAGVAIMISDCLIWLMEKRAKKSVPRLVQQITSVAVWFIVLFALAALIFKVPVGSVFTTSGILVGVIGLSLNRVFSDLFNGILLPNRIGDWIEVDGQPPGEVVEVNWRHTTLLTDDFVTVVVPNNTLVSKSYRVFTQPEDTYRERTPVLLPLWVKRDQAERVLVSAVFDVPELANLRPPALTIHGIRNGGVEWALRTYTPHARMTRLRGELRSRMANNLHIAGIPVLRESALLSDVEAAEGQRPLSTCLAYVSLFDSFDEETRRQLADLMHTQVYPAGVAIVTADDSGHSLFIMREGLAQALVPAEGGSDVVVGNITAGQVFGEMSLLTGAPRSATVKALTGCLVHEVTSDDLSSFLKARPALAERLARVVAQRQALTQSRLSSSTVQGGGQAADAASLLARLRSFLGL